MEVTWLGQGGFVVETAQVRLVIDPYLSDIVEQTQGLTRLLPPPLSIAELRPAAVLCTHAHLDHYDPVAVPQILAAYPQCQLVGPASVRAKAAGLNLAPDRLQPLEAGRDWSAPGLTVRATPAQHSDPHAVGLILQTADQTVYISGDTEYRADLAASVRTVAGRKLDAAFICINGRLGNMNADEALEVVKALAPGLVIPMHYGLFAENTADPAPFLRHCAAAGLQAQALEPGRPTRL